MRIFVKTLKGTHFEIEVKPESTVADVKKNIETIQGPDVYPAGQQMLIYQGKVLTDQTTLEENQVVERSFMVVMLTKNKASSSGVAAASASPSSTTQLATTTPPLAQPVSTAPDSALAPALLADVYDQAPSSLVAGSNMEETVQQILDMGGGSWDRDTVVRALRAAYNNPERAVDYLYSGIPEQAVVASSAQPPFDGQPLRTPAQDTQAAVPSSGPNANPLDLFPQGLPSMGFNAGAGTGTLDIFRNSQQFQALRAVVQANPQILQPMLQELGKQNPQLLQLIQEHQADFLRLINEPAEVEGNILDQLAEAMPQGQAVTVTPEEQEALERLEAMGFDRDLVLEVFFACNKNEELAANYLLDHMNEFDD